MSRKLLLWLGVPLLLVLARMSVFTVDRAEFVYLTQFGRHVATYDGAHPDQAGLHLRWPWPVQTVTRIDRRLQVLDLPAAELVTEDPREGGTIDKSLAIDAYVVWRVPDAEAVERFILTVGTSERAREILRDRVRSRLGAVVARMQMEDLISDSPGRVDRQRDLLRRKLLRLDAPYAPEQAACSLLQPAGQPLSTLLAAARAEDELRAPPSDGIEIVDIRVRRLNYPPQVRQAIFDRIISERDRKVAYHKSKGEAEAADIKSKSEANVAVELAKAKAHNDLLKAKADARAEEVLNDAIRKDPAYYAELKQREIGDLGLDAKKKVWSTQLFDYFFPRPSKNAGAAEPGANR